MARKPQVAVEPRPDGRWAVQTDGTQRADSLHDRKSDAVKRGRELAGTKQTELVIKDERGDTYLLKFDPPDPPASAREDARAAACGSRAL